MRRAKGKPSLVPAAAFLVYAVCVFALFQNTLRLRAIYPSASLRYTQPVSASVVPQVRRGLREGESTVWPTFWSQESAKLEVDGQVLDNVRNIRFDGDARLVWPARYLAGTRPGELDEDGCAVSAALACRLWGSLDAVGREVRIDGRPYAVRGIFEGEEKQVLTGYGGRENPDGWHAVELRGEVPADFHATSARFAQGMGLPEPDGIVSAGAVSAFGSLLAWVPMAVSGIIVLVQAWRVVTQRWGKKRELFLFAFLGLLALSLPRLLSQLPAFLIPGRWGNLSHWSHLADTGRELLHSWFTLVPMEKDALAKGVLLAQLLLCFGALTAAVALWRRIKTPVLQQESTSASVKNVGRKLPQAAPQQLPEKTVQPSAEFSIPM